MKDEGRIRLVLLVLHPSEQEGRAFMEIHALKVLFTEQDVNGLIAKGMGSNRQMEVRDLRVRLSAEGVYVTGTYEMRIVDLPFESLWQLSVLQGKLAVRLATFQ